MMKKTPALAARRCNFPRRGTSLAHGRGDSVRVTMVGKLLVHYKLGKPEAIRVANSVNSIATIEKYLKTHKAVLV